MFFRVLGSRGGLLFSHFLPVYISMAALAPRLLTWEQPEHSAAPAPSVGSTSLARAIAFGPCRFHPERRESENVHAEYTVTPGGKRGGGAVSHQR